MDPGYELYLKLMTEFPLPEEQYETMDLESLILEETGLDTPSPNDTYDSGKTRTGKCVNSGPEAAAGRKSSISPRSPSTTTARPRTHKPVIVLSHDEEHIPAHCSRLKEDLESRGYTVFSSDHSNSADRLPPNEKLQDGFSISAQ